MPFAAVLLLSLSLSSVDAAASADIALRDYVHTTWTQDNGEPLGTIAQIFQDPDGYLWLVTRNGLLKFDGMRFTRVPAPCRKSLEDGAIAPDGSVWIICGDQLLRRTPQGQFLEFHEPILRQPRVPVWLFIDQLSRPWLVGSTIRHLESDGTGGEEFARPTAAPIIGAALDARGTLWVSDPNEIVHLDHGRTERFPVKQGICLAASADGGIYAGSTSLLWRLRDKAAPQSFSAPPGVTFTTSEGSLREAPDGEVWIGTRQSGIAVLRHDRIETITDIGDRDRLISEVFIDREGTIWAAASSGLHRFRRPIVEILPAASKHLRGLPIFVFVDSRGATWVSPGTHGAHALNPDGNLAYAVAPPSTIRFLPSKFPNRDWIAIDEDHTGRIWLSNTREIGYVADGKFVTVPDEAGHAITEVWMFTRDPHGNLWAIAEGIGVYQITPGHPRLVISSSDASNRLLVSDRFGIWVALHSGGVQQYFNGSTKVFRDPSVDRADSIPRAFLEDGDSMWIGTFRGLKRWRNGVWTTWTSEHGLPGDGVLEAIVRDRLGRLWLMTAGGLLMLPRAPLDATPDGQPGPLTFARIGLLDGVAPHPGGMRSSPRAAIDRNGRLYFGTMDTVVTIDPSSVSTSSLAPPIVLETATVDNRPIELTTAQTFIEPTRVDFDYTSLSLRSPENARFRYRLEGYDTGWVEAGSQRHVMYGNLKPGAYRFKVIGAGSEGVWNEEGATFAFQIAPVYWRTWWFRLALLAAGALIVTGLHQLRVLQLTRRFNLALEARVGERTRVARDLHDTMLQTVQGSKLIADHALRDPGNHEQMVRTMGQLSKWMERATGEGRAALNSLRASNADNHLPDALRKAIDESRESGRLEIALDVIGAPRKVNALVGDDIVQIASEALRNACAHSGGNRIDVTVAYGNGFTLRVSDNGAGIAPGLTEKGRDGHFGLRGMKERAERIGSKLTIVGAPGAGTVVTLMIPGRVAFSKTVLPEPDSSERL